MYYDTKHWVETCGTCNRMKNPKYTRKAPLNPLPIANEPFDMIGIDCVGPLPESLNGHKYIVVITDYLTRWPEAFAVKSIEASVIAKILFDEILCRHGSPKKMLSDRGTNFLSELIAEICKLFETKQIRTSPYHPQCDGLTERMNGTLVKSLAMFTNEPQTDWDTFIPAVLFAYRTSVTSSTKFTPFELLYGREARLPIDVTLNNETGPALSFNEHLDRIKSNLQMSQAIAKQNMEVCQQKMKKHYDRNAKDSIFKAGDLVWLHQPKVKKGKTKKFTKKWQGPFLIHSVLGPCNFKLKRLSGRILPAPIHSDRLKSCKHQDDRIIGGNLEPDVHTPDDNNSDNDIYTVEKILEKKTKKGKDYYKVRWLGYSAKDDTWEPAHNIFNPKLMENFNKSTN